MITVAMTAMPATASAKSVAFMGAVVPSRGLANAGNFDLEPS